MPWHQLNELGTVIATVLGVCTPALSAVTWWVSNLVERKVAALLLAMETRDEERREKFREALASKFDQQEDRLRELEILLEARREGAQRHLPRYDDS